MVASATLIGKATVWPRGRAALPGSRRPCRRHMAVYASDSRKPWDFGRFVKTVTTFNPPPTVGQVVAEVVTAPLKIMKSLSPEEAKAGTGSGVETILRSAAYDGPSGAVVVSGARGPLGSQVVKALLARGRRVRILAPDSTEAKAAFQSSQVGAGGSCELVTADLSSSLPSSTLNGASAVICCLLEADHEGQLDEGERLAEFQNLVNAAEQSLGLCNGKAVFSPAGNGEGSRWAPLDDVVMGGCSISEFQVQEGKAEDGGPAGVFSGVVSTDNSGGFSSVRTLNMSPPLNLSAYTGLRLRVLGDGQRYKFIIRTDTNWDTVTYCLSFDTRSGEWQDVDLPFSEFRPVFRARTVTDGNALDPSQVVSIQLMLSKFEYDGDLNPSFRAGDFSLPVSSIRSYHPAPLSPCFVHVSAAGVTKAVDGGEPHAECGLSANALLQAEDMLRASGLPYAIVRPCTLSDGAAPGNLQVAQGDTLSGAVSREGVAELCASLLDGTPEALNCTFEVCSGGRPAGGTATAAEDTAGQGLLSRALGGRVLKADTLAADPAKQESVKRTEA